MNERALYECLMLIRNSNNMAPFREWLEDQRAQIRDRLETCKPEQVQVEQGRAQLAKELIGLIESAPKTLEKIVNRK